MTARHVSTARAVYDATAGRYRDSIGTVIDPRFEGPLDRAFLKAFAEIVGGSDQPVADLGCGPGRVAAYLAANGLPTIGVDVSPAMLAVARLAHPGLRFEEGMLTALPFDDHSLAGAVCWYSIIHTPPDGLGEVFVELARVIAPQRFLLMAFQSGDGTAVERPDAHGSGLTLTSYRHSAEDVARCAGAAGLRVHARASRDPEFAHESTPQAFLLLVRT